MANIALAACRFVLYGVASVTIRMRLKSDGYRFSSSRRFMAIVTIGNRNVSRMIKFHVESFDKFRGESLDRRILPFCIGVADSAHHLLLIDELIQVTADAGFVPAKFTFDATCLALMASIAGELYVLRNAVRKRFECLVRNTLRYRIRRFRRGQCHGRLCRLLNARRRKKRSTDDDEHSLQHLS